MSYLSFENNIIEASGNLILKSTSGVIDCSNATISNVTIKATITDSERIKVTSIEASLNDISFNNSNLLDVSSIQVNNDVSCSSIFVDTINSKSNSNVNIKGNLTIDGSLIIQTGEITLIKTKDLDISDNIIGLNRGHTGGNNTSGMLINYDISNIFFGYHDTENAFVIADTSYNHDDDSRNIVLDNYVDLKVGNVNIVNTDPEPSNNPKAQLNIYGNSYASSAQIFLGQQSKVGAGIRYNGNNDKMEFYNRDASSESVVMSYNYNSNNVTFNGSVDASSNMFQTVLEDVSFSYIQLDRKDCSLNQNIITTKIGYLNSTNNVLHITNNADYIYLARYTDDDTVTPYLNIGQYISGTATDLSNYKHVSNVMIQAPSFSGDLTNTSGLTLTGHNSKTFIIGANDKHESNVMIQAPSFNATSDYRTKTNIEDLDETITVSNLRPLVYIKNGKKEIGLIAHELQEVYPFMVCGEKDGEQMQSVNYNGLIGVLINDVKRLNNENKKLKSEYETLKSENSEIKSRLDTLEEKFNKRFE